MDPWEKKRLKPRLHLPDSERLAQKIHPEGVSLFLARNADKLGLKVYGFVRVHWLGIINFHLVLFLLGSVSASYLSYLGEEGVAKYIYGFYGISCHQISSRSFFVFDHQIGICARCFSFYASMLVFGLWLSLKNVRPLDGRTALFLVFPIIMDVLLQTLGIRESTNLLRVTTAILLSLSVSLYIYPRAKSSIDSVTQN